MKIPFSEIIEGKFITLKREGREYRGRVVRDNAGALIISLKRTQKSGEIVYDGYLVEKKYYNTWEDVYEG